MSSKSILLFHYRQFKKHLLNSRITSLLTSSSQLNSCSKRASLPYIPLLVFSLTTTSYAGYHEVDSFDDLKQAIEKANAKGDINGLNNPYIIELKSDITLTALLPLIESHLVILGNGYTIEGDEDRLLLIKGGNLHLLQLTLKGGVAQGGAGRDGGGGGAGLGGALFIFEGQVIAKQVTFEANQAQGGAGGPSRFFDAYPGYNGGGGGFCGDGGYSTQLTGGGGGGLCGNGGNATLTQGGDGGGIFGGNGGTEADPDGQPGGLASGGGGGFGEQGRGGGGSFGGGGGGGISAGGQGGFAGGGGSSDFRGGNGGFGGGGGTTLLMPDCGPMRSKRDSIACVGVDLGGQGGFGGGDSGLPWGGGGGAGFGGAVFIMGGQLTLDQVTFNDNSAIGGAPGFEAEIEPGQGKGGAVFICSDNEDPLCQGQINACPDSVTFANNSATDDEGVSGDDDNVYGQITEISAACHNIPPIITDPFSKINVRVGDPERIIPLDAYFDDVEDEQLSYNIFTNTQPNVAEAVIDDLGQLHLNFTAKGTTHITLRATDTQGASAEETLTVTTKGDLAVLETFIADSTPAGIRLSWDTLSEQDSAGFYVVRSIPGQEELIMPLIHAQGSAYQGGHYTFIDSNVESGMTYRYQLQEMDTQGQKMTYKKLIEVSF